MADRYWVGGAATWDATVGTKWATTSGGTGGASVPTNADNAFFDAASGTVTVTASSCTCLDLNFTGFTGTLAGSGGMNVKGSLTLNATMGYSHSGSWTFNSTTTGKTVNWGVKRNASSGSVTFNGSGGGWTLSGGGWGTASGSLTFTAGSVDLNGVFMNTGTGGTCTHTAGTLTMNGGTIDCGTFTTSGSGVRTLDWGSVSGGKILCRSGFTGTTTTNLTVSNPANGSINLYATSSGTKTFSGGGTTINWGSLVGDGTSTTSVIFVIAGNNTFQEIKPKRLTTMRFTSGTTQVVQDLNWTGASSNLITIDTTTAGTQATISCASGDHVISFVSIKDNNATGGAGFYFGASVTNVSNNTGWLTVANGTAHPTTAASTTGRGTTTENTDVNLSLTNAGVGTGGVGTPVATTRIDASTGVTTVLSTGQIGTLLASISISTDIDGNEADGFAGTPQAGTFVTQSVIGNAATGSAGSPVVNESSNVIPIGINATGQAGSPVVNESSNVIPIGINATYSPGNTLATVTISKIPTGNAATGSPGSPVVNESSNVIPIGINTTGSPGSPTVIIITNITPLGINATGFVGSPFAAVSVSKTVLGLAATSALGTVVAVPTTNVFPINAHATGAAGLVHGKLDLNAPLLNLGVRIGAGFYKVTTIKFGGDPVPIEHMEDALKLDADAYVDLFQIILNDNATKIYLKLNSSKTWQGNEYEGTAVKLEGVAQYADDTVARPTFNIYNPEGVFSFFVDQGQLDSSTIVRYRVLKEHLDADLPIYRRQQWRVSRVASVKSGYIALELRDMLDGQMFLTPGRMFIPPDFPTVSLQ